MSQASSPFAVSHLNLHTKSQSDIPNPPGIAETLHEEISPFGLRSIHIDPGCFKTKILAFPAHPKWQCRIPDYQEAGDAANAALTGEH